MNAGNRGRRGRRALSDLRRAAGVVAVYAEIAGSGTDSAFVAMATATRSLRLIWHNLSRLKIGQPDPLGELFVALDRGQLGASKIFANLPLSRNS